MCNFRLSELQSESIEIVACMSMVAVSQLSEWKFVGHDNLSMSISIHPRSGWDVDSNMLYAHMCMVECMCELLGSRGLSRLLMLDPADAVLNSLVFDFEKALQT